VTVGIQERYLFHTFTSGDPSALSNYVKKLSPMLKIQRSSNAEVVFTLIGRIENDDIPELQRIFSLEEAGRSIALDLEDVTLIDRDAVKFLARCEADSIRLENCPAFIREWIGQEKMSKVGKQKLNGKELADDGRPTST
jgi:hypothetical protein